MKSYYEDIICARATPSGASAIAIIRVSGKNSHKVLSNIFVSKSGKKIDFFQSHRAYFGNIIDENGIVLDEVLVVTFSDGKSFTGEESFEINCHGSEIVISLILNLLYRNGCRLSEPGEFSKRAFLNGKIDLSQAEAIMDIVNSSTKDSALIATQQLNGKVKNDINQLKEKISDLLAELEVYIDYPEEDLTIDSQRWCNQILDLINQNQNLLDGFERGKYYRQGIVACILGKTNAGKSTLFNFLLNEDKAIVSDIHGTTRDYLDGVINIKGFGVRLYDTAGLRKTDDPIELEGTKRAIQISDRADIVLYVIGLDYGLTNNDIENILSIDKEKKILIVLNKIDIIDNFEKEEKLEKMVLQIKEITKDFRKIDIVKISSLKKIGLEEFNNKFINLLIENNYSEKSDITITNERHANLLSESIIFLNNAFIRLKEGYLDLAGFEIREALNKLGEITGEVTPVDIINKIFSTFCIGK